MPLYGVEAERYRQEPDHAFFIKKSELIKEPLRDAQRHRYLFCGELLAVIEENISQAMHRLDLILVGHRRLESDLIDKRLKLHRRLLHEDGLVFLFQCCRDRSIA